MSSQPEPAEVFWTPEMVSRFWDFESHRPELYFSFQVGRAIVHKLRHIFRKADRIVDFGAGPGYLIEELLREGHTCAAVEFSGASIDLLREKFSSDPKFIGARSPDDMAGWEGSFDLALLIEVVEHLYDPELDACLSDIRRLLKPDGILVVTAPNDEDRSKYFILSPESGKVFHRWQHVRSWSPQTLPEKLRQSGFEPLEIKTRDFAISPYADYRTRRLPMRIAFAAGRAIRYLIGTKPPHLLAVSKNSKRVAVK